jgi:hypothetical protein
MTHIWVIINKCLILRHGKYPKLGYNRPKLGKI